MRLMQRPVWLAAALLLSLALGSARGDDERPFSVAEKTLFMDDHFHQFGKKPVTLRYTFRKTGSLEAPYTDEAWVDVKPATGEAPGHAVSTRFLTKDHQLDLPDISSAEGNPVIMYFLERDVREMQRVTKGQANYYRKRIRLALADSADVKPFKFKFAGKELNGTEITVYPYLDDPAKSRFARYADKTYRFILSDQVPGTVYEMHTLMRDSSPGGDGKPLIDETLTFADAK